MKAHVLTLALSLVTSLALANTPCAHGGQYRGPGDTVPPGGSGTGGGGGGTPGPTGPSGPGSGPDSPGPTGPANPSTPPGGVSRGISPGSLGSPGPDLTSWTFWWEFNKEAFLNLKTALHIGGTTTGSDNWFLGHGVQEQGKRSLRPTEAQIRGQVVPALLRTLETETNNDIVTGALIALAKIGDVHSEDGGSLFLPILEQELSNANQEIAETAAVSLGILANSAAIDLLEGLVLDTPLGRTRAERREVPVRTRAFAAFGLGLVGAAPETTEAQRQRIVTALVTAVETDDTSSRDLQVACLVSLGLVPLHDLDAPVVEGDGRARVHSRTDQIDWLLAFLRDEKRHDLVRAHAPTALVRLLEGLPVERYETLKATLATDWIPRLGKRSKDPDALVQSIVLALGLLGDLDADPIDREIRAALAATPRTAKNRLARNFSFIAMGQLAGRSGTGADLEEGLREARRFLSEGLARGKMSGVKPWAGLGLGLFGRGLAQRSGHEGTLSELGASLRTALEEERSPRLVGAYAIACGLLRDQESEAILLEKLARIQDDETRGYLAVALGLLGARDTIPTLQALVADSAYRHDLLKQVAVALGLLGDKEVVASLARMLATSKSLATQAAVSSALGAIGDTHSIEPLLGLLESTDVTDRARGFAAAALGIVGDKELLRWNAKIAADLNYTAATTTLNDPAGTGILNIL